MVTNFLGNEDAQENSVNLINEISRDLEEIDSQFFFDKRSSKWNVMPEVSSQR